MGLCLLHRLEAVDQLVRSLAEHDGAGNLRIEAAGTVVLDQQGEMLAGHERTRLQVPVDEARRLAERRRRSEEQTLLAAEEPTFVLRQRGNVIVAHAGPDLLQYAVENLVLHLRRFPYQRPFLVALDRLEVVDEFGRIHEFGLALELMFDTRHELVRHRPAADPADGAVAAALELF